MQESLPDAKGISSADDPTDSLPLTQNARRVLDRRYLIRDRDGTPTETPDSPAETY